MRFRIGWIGKTLLLLEESLKSPNARRQERRAYVDDFDNNHEDEFEDEDNRASLNGEGRFVARGERRGRGFPKRSEMAKWD
jgi:hypothetical protein